MRKAHGFFIPLEEKCKSVDKLIYYLAEKLSKGLLCIFCDNNRKEYDSL